MAQLINELSWYHSRRNTFEECQRKYFYQYYGSWEGWLWNATQRQKELYLHKKLVNRWMWMGTVVHKTIEFLLKQHREGDEIQPLDYYQDLLTKKNPYQVDEDQLGFVLQHSSKSRRKNVRVVEG